MTAIRDAAERILLRAAGEGDRAQHGGGGRSGSPRDRLGVVLSRSSLGQGGGCPLHHPSDGPPPPFHGGGRAPHIRGLAICAFAVATLTSAFAGDIAVTAAWLRATPKGAPVAGGYATIVNKGTTPDRLVGASIPMAPQGEVHSMSMTDGVMHMQRLDKGLAIPPGATVSLTPGGYHLMFIKPTALLKEGDKVDGSLTFEKAGKIAVTFPVAGFGAKEAPK